MTTQSFKEKLHAFSFWLVIVLALIYSCLTFTQAFGATRTTIMKQEEGQTEKAVQLRAADPTSPATNQLWINTTSDAFKYFDSTVTHVVGSSSTTDQPYELTNLSLSATVSANALTVALKDKSGSDPSSGSPVKIGFRNSTLTTGTYNQRSVTGALSVVVPSGTTIGTVSAVQSAIYVYALDNAGTVELAVSLNRLDVLSVQSTTAISGGALAGTIYSTTSRSNVPMRYIGRILITEATAGTWATSPTEVAVPNLEPISGPASSVYGQVKWPSATNCAWIETSNAYANFSADSDCTLPSGSGIKGNASAPATKVPAITFATLPRGEYEFVAIGGFLSSTSANVICYLRFHDGTNPLDGENIIRDSGGVGSAPLMMGRLSVPTDRTNVTVQIQMKNSDNSGQCFLSAENSELVIYAKRFSL